MTTTTADHKSAAELLQFGDDNGRKKSLAAGPKRANVPKRRSMAFRSAAAAALPRLYAGYRDRRRRDVAIRAGRRMADRQRLLVRTRAIGSRHCRLRRNPRHRFQPATLHR